MHKHSRNLVLIAVALVVSAAVATHVAADTHADKPAEEGCKPKVKTDLLKKLTPTKESIERGKKSYKTNCAICHGEKGLGDGIGGAALDPKPRNFAKEAFVNTTSPTGLFKTLAEGLEGTAMAGFAHLPEEDRWGMVHYMRAEMIPEDKHVTPTDEQIEEICIELSAPPKNPEIPVEIAMAILAEEGEASWTATPDYGPVKLAKEIAAPDATVAKDVLDLGAQIYGANCGSCHGSEGAGMRNVSRAGRYPFLDISTRPLSKNHAGGTWMEFAERGAMGAHATLPDMSGAALLNVDQWRALQAWTAQLKGDAKVTTDRPPQPKTALLYVGESYEIHLVDGFAYKIAGEARTPIASWEELRGLMVTASLPETSSNVIVKGWWGLECIGKTCKDEKLRPASEMILKFTAPEAPVEEAQ